ncbi:hypothetical protein BK133_18660 [Paenibacillus sp. FSL H8-0548]|uniref:hypothetical protein n=1 Tax=Paenibacillus sp. FSL H8-0548 TaxID=1920422 RepID=UPI00096DC583|nr:hypothetical protein [Paenibacillus sp. FSL H8-0548]OMF28675.1 hypothetical protein BK133_18660 [Paenibacillus sp. FSL H8-0548]
MIDESNLKDLRKHSNDLAKFMYYLEMYDRQNQWSQAAEWLEIASGIKEINFDLNDFNDSYGWCGHADSYDDRRELLLKKFITEISVFNFIWGSLESLIDIINPPEAPKYRGKINSSCYYLKLTDSLPLPLYKELLSKLNEHFSELNSYKDIIDEFRLKPFLNISGVALNVIYKVRNRLAHGALHFPQPEDDEDIEYENRQIHLIQLCSRLILLSVQMLIISHFKNNNITISIDGYSSLDFNFSGIDRDTTVADITRGLHIIIEEDDNQLTLNLNL